MSWRNHKLDSVAGGGGSDVVSMTVTGIGGQVPFFSHSFPLSLQRPLWKAPSREQLAELNYGQQTKASVTD